MFCSSKRDASTTKINFARKNFVEEGGNDLDKKVEDQELHEEMKPEMEK